MANILFLAHRLPYPPNKGDKVRSYHLLKHLAARHRVYLGTFVDDPADWQYVETLRGLCTEVHAVDLHPFAAKLKSLRGLLGGEALSLPYYRDAGLARWVHATAAATRLDGVLAFSSPMAQYAQALPGLPLLVDFVDVDSAKWSAYAEAHRWPLSWLYRREGRELLAAEQAVAGRAQCSFFVTDKEAELFRELSPALTQPVEAVSNGVDAAYFSPDPARASPFPAGQLPLVFTGAMDYWPNADAVIWFAKEVMPQLRVQCPAAHFHIVGRSPTPAVLALADGVSISVSGTVPDVRSYLQYASAVVAPLRLARGIQNKILEAMSMGRPVVAATSCVQAMAVEEGVEIRAADDVGDYLRHLTSLLRSPEVGLLLGDAGRARILRSYSWDAHLAGIDRHLDQWLAREIAA